MAPPAHAGSAQPGQEGTEGQKGRRSGGWGRGRRKTEIKFKIAIIIDLHTVYYTLPHSCTYVYIHRTLYISALTLVGYVCSDGANRKVCFTSS